MKSFHKALEKLNKAIQLGDIDLVREILEMMDITDGSDDLLFDAIRSYSGAGFPIVKLLIERGAKPNYVHFCEAIDCNDLKTIELFLNIRSEGDDFDRYSYSVLEKAIFEDREIIALALIEAGAVIVKNEFLGCLTICGAIINDLQQVLKEFQKRRINIDLAALKPYFNRLVSLEDLDGAALIADSLWEDFERHELAIAFFSLDAEEQLEILPTLEREYLFNFSGGDVLSNLALAILAEIYYSLLSSINYHFWDENYPEAGKVVESLRILLYAQIKDKNSWLSERLFDPKWTFIRWLSQYLRDYFYIDISITKKDMEKLIFAYLHP